MQPLKDRHGKVLSGEYEGWTLRLVDDSQGQTGGYYLILSNQVSSTIYDYWFEHIEQLENQLEAFEVTWL